MSAESKANNGDDPGRKSHGGISSSVISSKPPSSRPISRVDQAKAVVKRMVAVKSVDELVAQGEASDLHRTLGAFDLTLLGVGEIVGKGLINLYPSYSLLLCFKLCDLSMSVSLY